jgi:hypothetical protein
MCVLVAGHLKAWFEDLKKRVDPEIILTGDRRVAHRDRRGNILCTKVCSNWSLLCEQHRAARSPTSLSYAMGRRRLANQWRSQSGLTA